MIRQDQLRILYFQALLEGNMKLLRSVKRELRKSFRTIDRR